MTNKENTHDNTMDDNAKQTPIGDNSTVKESYSELTENTAFDDDDLVTEDIKEAIKEDIPKENENINNEIDKPSNTSSTEKPKKKFSLFMMIRILCAVGFVVFTGLFINEVVIQPYRANKAIKLTRELYNSNITPAPTQATKLTKAPLAADVTPAADATFTTDPTRDSQGRLLSFKDLLSQNEDTKGWLTIPETNIDYVIMQNSEDPLYYLSRDFNKANQKAGCLFLDYHSSVENNTKNYVIHGHNMKSTNSMFHHLVKFKKLDFYKTSPVITFDTIYQTGQWKIFSVFITNGTSDKEPLFDYTRSTFKDSSDYMNFIYQLRNRSVFNMDTVDINENDQILTLSTCSYEINNYRTVVVARKVRDGEDATVDVDSVTKNKKALYPGTYYKNYGGEAPEFPATFEKALEEGTISWYKLVEDKKDKE